jgi:hypothetical protein
MIWLYIIAGWLGGNALFVAILNRHSRGRQ